MSLAFAVVGNPVAHSLSPQIHQAFAEQCNLNLTYDRLLLERDEFNTGVAQFFSSGGDGLNVTLPFKQQACAWVDQLEPGAAAAGAVNTIARAPSASDLRAADEDSKADAFIGYNTDGQGLVADLIRNLGFAIKGSRILLLGAGGAAQGVLAYLLAESPASLVLANRTQAKAVAVVQQITAHTPAALGELVTPTGLDDLTGEFDLVINATSASVAGQGAIVDAQVLAEASCYDMMYGPNTAFCEFAQQAGAAAVADGLGMLVEQAAAAFEIWHGAQPMLDALAVLADLRVQGLGLVPQGFAGAHGARSW